MRPTIVRFITLPFFLPAALALGCSGATTAESPSEAPGSASEGLVSSTGPIAGPPVPGVLPALRGAPAAVALPEAPATSLTSNDVHEGRFTGARDLAARPSSGSGAASSSTNLEAWITNVRGDTTSTAPSFADRSVAASTLPGAVDLARTGAGTDLSELDAILSSAVPPGLGTMSVTLGQEKSFAFAPERARWLKGQYNRDGVALDRRLAYSDPRAFDEVRQRGARLYCAAKEAYRNGRATYGRTNRVMGRTSLVDLDILGTPLRLFSVEPTVALKAPRKLTSTTPDGAQAFVVPLEVGARVSPASFLPSLPEVRVPVSIVTGDSEVLTRADVGPVSRLVFVRNPDGTFSARSVTTNEPRKDYQTATNAYAVVTGEKSFRVDTPRIPLFTLGPVSATLSFGLGFYMRALSESGRLLQGGPAGFPSARRGAWTQPPVSTQPRFFDGAWSLASYAPSTSSILATGIDTRTPVTTPRLALEPGNPFLTRALEDDDKGIVIESGGTMSSTLAVQGGIALPFLTVGIETAARLAGEAGVRHYVRETEEIGTRLFDGVEFDEHTPVPQTSLSVAPSLYGRLIGGWSAGFVFRLDLGIFSLNLGFPIVDVSGTLAEKVGDPWSEGSRLRLGTSSAFDRAPYDGIPANVRTKPDVMSHWPNPGDLRAFPSFAKSVDECLAEPEETPVEPPTCASTAPTTGTGTTPSVNMCAYYPVYWTGEFGPGGTAAQDVCISRLQTFLRSGTSKRQSFEADYRYRGETIHRSELVDARVVPLDGDGAVATEWRDVLAQCGRAFGTAERTQEVAYVGACRNDATLLQHVIEPVGGSTTPPEAGVGTCR